MFVYPIRGHQAGQQLTKIRQGQLTVREFVVNFRGLAVELGWNEAALITAFQNGLNRDIGKEIALRGEFRTLDEAIQLAIKTGDQLLLWRVDSAGNPNYCRSEQLTSLRPCREMPYIPEPETIVPPSCIIAVLTWEIEATVRQAQTTQPDPGTGPPNCLFVPDSVRSQVLQWAHSSRLTCHPGIHWIISFLKRRFWWPTMDTDTRSFVAACTICSRNKTSNKPSSGLLRPLPIPGSAGITRGAEFHARPCGDAGESNAALSVWICLFCLPTCCTCSQLAG